MFLQSFFVWNLGFAFLRVFLELLLALLVFGGIYIVNA